MDKTIHTFTLSVLFILIGCAPDGERPLRILTGGIMHESNTFNPLATTLDDFTIRRGPAATQGAPWARALKEAGADVVVAAHADAGSGGVVTAKAYEAIKTEILEAARQAGEVDGVYLEMHGALHVDGYEDAQADFVTALRKIVGDTIISASFDLHGNMSPAFVEDVNICTAYRTAPHTDGVETRLRAVRLLLKAIHRKQHPRTVLVQVPIIVPGEKGITAVEPLKSLYSQLPSVADIQGVADASIFVGMAWTDVQRAGMSVLAVAENDNASEAAKAEAVRLAMQLWEKRAELKFDVVTDTLDGAISTALQAPEKTVFITDSGDNVTAGTPGDVTLVLERLLRRAVRDAVVAGIVDPEAVAACDKAGIGNRVQLTVGGKLDTVTAKPLKISGTVQFLSPLAEDAVYEIIPGLFRPAGRTAVVEVNGIQVALVSLRRAFTAPEHLRAIGIDPLAYKIVVVKQGYLFQALREIAPRAIMALTPGSAYQLVEELPYRNVRRPIYPLDPAMSWSPE